MRPITKIFLLIVVAFVVYLLLPRTPNVKAFDPAALAKLEVAGWRAEKAGQGFGAVIAQFKIYTSQYHFSPVAAFRMAQSQENALEEVKRSHAKNIDSAEDVAALSAMTEKFTLMKQQMGGDFDVGALAREEVALDTLLLENAPASEVAAPITRILAGIYGGLPEDFVDVAANLAYAQLLICGTQAAPDVTDPVKAAEDAATEGNKLLKEIAATPVKQP